jgi:type II secretory pathway component GspD/PulD (secretin)
MKASACVAAVLALVFVLGVSGVPAQEQAELNVWVLPAAAEGYSLSDLIQKVGDVTGETIVFNPQDPQVRSRKVYFTGEQRIARERVFDWFRSMLTYHKLVVVPLGPQGRPQWAILNMNDPSIALHPVYVPEEELEPWSDRDGAYIVTVLSVKHLQDTTRARNALANLISRPVGRINDVPGTRSFVVGDFAPVVYAMHRLLRSMDKPGVIPALPMPSRGTRQPQPTVDPVRKEITRLETLLANSETEVAAEYFIERLEELRGDDEEGD